MATQIMARVLESYFIEVPLRRFFENPTVAGLAVAIAQCQAEQTDSDEIAELLAELEQLQGLEPGIDPTDEMD